MKTDLELQKDVQEELDWSPKVDAAGLRVNAKDGVITLTGIVKSLPAKREAELVALHVARVKAVINQIAVVLPGEIQRTDAEIAQAVFDAVKWNALVPLENDIQVIVQDGWVTLDGQLEWQYQKKAAEDLIQQLIGVKGITNNILVKPHVSASAVAEKIEAAFTRNASLDAKGIQVEANDGLVILEGAVQSWAERDDAEIAAWSAPGFHRVINNLMIDEN